MNGDLQVEFMSNLQIRARQRTAEHDNVGGDTGVPQPSGFGKPGDRQAIDVSELARDGQQPMAIGVRLDDRHYAGAWRLAPNQIEIVADSTQPDTGTGTES